MISGPVLALAAQSQKIFFIMDMCATAESAFLTNRKVKIYNKR